MFPREGPLVGACIGPAWPVETVAMSPIRFEDLDASISVAREGRYWVLTCRQTVPTPVDDLFPFTSLVDDLFRIVDDLFRLHIARRRPVPDC